MLKIKLVLDLMKQLDMNNERIKLRLRWLTSKIQFKDLKLTEIP